MRVFGQTRTRTVTWLLAIAFAFCVPVYVLGVPAECAHAYFNEVTSDYYAGQELSAYGSPIYGDQLPDDVYPVSVTTSSSMFNIYSESVGNESKYQANVIVSGGAMTAVFYTSGRYNYLYEGTMEEASSATNAEGTDASAYYAGDPEVGYSRHGFAIPIVGLNVPMTIATYAGGYEGDTGEKSLTEGMWYTREVVFCMSDEQFQAITASSAEEPEQIDDSDQNESEGQGQEQYENDSQGQPEGDGQGQPEGDDQGQPFDFSQFQPTDADQDQYSDGSDGGPNDGYDSSHDGDSDDGSSGGSDEEGGTTPDSEGDQGQYGEDESGQNDLGNDEGAAGQDDASEEEPSQSQETSAAENDSESNPGDGSGEGSGYGPEGESDNPSADENGQHVSIPNPSSTEAGKGPDGMPAVRFRLAKAKEIFDNDIGDGALLETPAEIVKPLLTQEQILALVIMAIFGAGIIARVVLFLKGYESYSDTNGLHPGAKTHNESRPRGKAHSG